MIRAPRDGRKPCKCGRPGCMAKQHETEPPVAFRKREYASLSCVSWHSNILRSLVNAEQRVDWTECPAMLGLSEEQQLLAKELLVNAGRSSINVARRVGCDTAVIQEIRARRKQQAKARYDAERHDIAHRPDAVAPAAKPKSTDKLGLWLEEQHHRPPMPMDPMLLRRLPRLPRRVQAVVLPIMPDLMEPVP